MRDHYLSWETKFICYLTLVNNKAKAAPGVEKCANSNANWFFTYLLLVQKYNNLKFSSTKSLETTLSSDISFHELNWLVWYIHDYLIFLPYNLSSLPDWIALLLDLVLLYVVSLLTLISKESPHICGPPIVLFTPSVLLVSHTWNNSATVPTVS